MKKSGPNPPREDEVNAIVAAIEQSLAQGAPDDPTERDAVVAAAVAEVNARPLDDFAGLSPEQMRGPRWKPRDCNRNGAPGPVARRTTFRNCM